MLTKDELKNFFILGNFAAISKNNLYLKPYKFEGKIILKILEQLNTENTFIKNNIRLLSFTFPNKNLSEDEKKFFNNLTKDDKKIILENFFESFKEKIEIENFL